MTDKKQAIIQALRAFINQRPGFETCNYATMSDYRQDYRKAQRDKGIALQLLRDIENRDEITAEMIEAEATNRLTVEFRHWDNVGSKRNVCRHCGEASNAHRGTMLACEAPRIDYCTGQYFPVEYRAAAARLCASVLWTWQREHMPPRDAYKEVQFVGQDNTYDAMSAGDWLRAKFRAEYGKRIADRFFD